MIILNLGCGTQTSAQAEVINLDWSIALRIRRSRILRTFASIIIGRGERLSLFQSLPDNIMVWNLAKGIPFDSNTVDAVYHSHLLEHLDRDVASHFLLECKRVLKPGGILRVVVPDFEQLCGKYLSHIAICKHTDKESKRHVEYISSIIEQSVRKEAWGTSQQKTPRRFIENFFLGDARRRGHTHQWMYDRISLTTLLNELGFCDICEHLFNTSNIVDWKKYKLDISTDGSQYKENSLYIEASK